MFIHHLRYPVSDYGQRVIAVEASAAAVHEYARQMLSPGEPYLLDVWELGFSREGCATTPHTVPMEPAT